MTKTERGLNTPTPWEVSFDQDTKELTICKDRARVAFVTNECGLSEAAANAEFMVRAVNSHDELVAQLKHAVGALRFGRKPDECYLKAMEEAIAKSSPKGKEG